eukprot:TRINITY_DN73428_c0_g1_i1.p1 TRINITY_DN73428_c0_g1~~TRINITY_DN73428_c0_g1_i1.p1  ORF type:complete len:457 (-),score=90.55 TRINITY_DN73428_c0_g1_i1:244-1614(-)
MKVGKTEVQIKLRGRDSRKAISTLNINANGRLAIEFDTSRGVIEVNVTRCYKHLGSTNCDSGEVSSDIRHRVNTMKANVQHLVPVFKDPTVDLDHKYYLFNCIAVPSTMYASATWPVLKEKQHKSITSAFFKIQRMFYNAKDNFAISHRQVQSHESAVFVEARITCTRLLYFATLGNAPRALIALLQEIHRIAEQNDGMDFLTVIRRDIMWLKTQFENIDQDDEMLKPNIDVRELSDDLDSVFQLASANRKRWKKMVRRGEWNFARRMRITDEQGEPIFDDTLAAEDGVDEKDDDDEQSELACSICGKLERSSKALNMHMVSKHGKRAEESWLADPSGYCEVCCTHFHTRSRLQEHLHRVPFCFTQLAMRGRCMNAEQRAAAIDHDRKRTDAFTKRGWRRSYADVPAIKTVWRPTLPVQYGPVYLKHVEDREVHFSNVVQVVHEDEEDTLICDLLA